MNDLDVRLKNEAELEMRVRRLEERLAIFEKKVSFKVDLTREEVLIRQHGEVVDKTVAARILGVTRATVYAMLSDGRIAGACGGRKVDVRNIARYMDAKRKVDEHAG